MIRSSTRTSADRVAMGMSRAVIDTINDSPFMQQLGLKIRGAESSSDVEHWHPFGSTAYPMGKTTDEQAKQGMMKGAPEVLLNTLMGNQSHPIAMPAADRRFRPNGMKAGEHVLHDAFKQFLHFAEKSATLVSPMQAGIQVAKEKQKQDGGQSQGQSGSQQGGQQKRNNGADVAAEREVAGGLTFDKDGNWTLEFTGTGKIKIDGCEWEFTKSGLIQKGGDYVKHDDRNIGKNHKHGQVQPGGGQTGDPVA